jgi:hypothetical protein
MVVLHVDAMRIRIALESLFSVDGRLGRTVLHVVHVLQVRKVIDKYRRIPVALLSRDSLQLRVEAYLQ